MRVTLTVSSAKSSLRSGTPTDEGSGVRIASSTTTFTGSAPSSARPRRGSLLGSEIGTLSNLNIARCAGKPAHEDLTADILAAPRLCDPAALRPSPTSRSSPGCALAHVRLLALPGSSGVPDWWACSVLLSAWRGCHGEGGFVTSAGLRAGSVRTPACPLFGLWKTRLVERSVVLKERTCTACGEPCTALPGGQASRFHNILFGATVFSGRVIATRTICLACGHLDAWVDPSELSRLADKLDKG